MKQKTAVNSRDTCLSPTARALLSECRVVLIVRSADELTRRGGTDMQVQVIDRCAQLFGGYGYMLEYPIARNVYRLAGPEDLRRRERGHEGTDRALAVALIR